MMTIYFCQSTTKRERSRISGKWKINMMQLLISILFFFGSTVCNAGGNGAEVENTADIAVQVKIPDGAYLYYSNFNNLKKNIFSPLFLIKGGAIIDPYNLTKKTSIQRLEVEYFTAKEFAVYRGIEKIGKLSRINLALKNICKVGALTVSELLSDVVGSGSFTGSPILPRSFSAKRDKKMVYEPVEIIITPATFIPKSGASFSVVTEDEKKKMIGSFRQKLLPTVWKQLDDFLVNKSKHHVVSEGESRLFAAAAIDLDGNGKKDYVGIYNLTVKVSAKGLSSISTLFVLWDTGKVEMIATDNLIPGFSIIGVIDIDQDGVQELVFQRVVEVYQEGLYSGRQIQMLRHESSGWKTIYRSKPICGPLSFY
jgi:hypothetical protein